MRSGPDPGGEHCIQPFQQTVNCRDTLFGRNVVMEEAGEYLQIDSAGHKAREINMGVAVTADKINPLADRPDCVAMQIGYKTVVVQRHALPFGVC